MTRLRWVLLLVPLAAAHVVELNITVPDFPTSEPDTYVCTTLRLPEKPYRLVGIQPLAEQNTVHHILLFGCNQPHLEPKGSESVVWNCGEAPTCTGNSDVILYGWGKNAPRLQLPEGVSVAVGPHTNIKYIVAQVHFLSLRPKGDRSGVTLSLRPHSTPYSAGMLSYASSFVIPPRRNRFLVPNECCYQGFQPLNTFAARVHTHTLGRRVWMLRANASAPDGADLVVDGNPQLPQGFYPVAPSVIMPGDRLRVTCEFDSTSRQSSTGAGMTHGDEMCNMYLMVAAPLPHNVMCSGGYSMVDDEQPGTMDRQGNFIPDPFEFKPPPVGAASGPGHVTGVALGPDGSVWSLHRGSHVWDASTFDADFVTLYREPIEEAVVVQSDADTGRVLQRWGARTFYMPHSITVDRHSNVWVVDVALHQVLKFSRNGTLLRTWGTAKRPGEGAKGFCQPTEVAVLSDGSFVVSDGYCASRVALFDRAGRFAGELQAPLAVSHSVAVQECGGRVFVASRENGQVLVFDMASKQQIDVWDLSSHGQVWSLVLGPYESVLALVWSRELRGPARLVDFRAQADYWELPGLEDAFPHSVALGAAAAGLTGAGERLFAVYVAPTCGSATCGPLTKFVLLPQDMQLAPKDTWHHGAPAPATHAGQGQPAPTAAGQPATPASSPDATTGAAATGTAPVNGTGSVNGTAPVDGTGSSVDDDDSVLVVLKNGTDGGKIVDNSDFEMVVDDGGITAELDTPKPWVSLFNLGVLCTILGAGVGSFAYSLLNTAKAGSAHEMVSLLPDVGVGGLRGGLNGDGDDEERASAIPLSTLKRSEPSGYA